MVINEYLREKVDSTRKESSNGMYLEENLGLIRLLHASPCLQSTQKDKFPSCKYEIVDVCTCVYFLPVGKVIYRIRNIVPYMPLVIPYIFKRMSSYTVMTSLY